MLYIAGAGFHEGKIRYEKNREIMKMDTFTMFGRGQGKLKWSTGKSTLAEAWIVRERL